ncbi:hypothetical protein JCM19231_3302 [Vibrio ishigakensis]|uniref:DUF1538 domain-containing protein n=1 Tax=Vibrio ishigakensis TaxID=1481914 RepID=A0A0B8NT83_9VIBR|nr:hypothetical protein JCM19231_3302 [Vibrio ishigakensis]
MIELMLDVFLSTIRDVIPIAVILFGFQVAVLRRPIANLKQVLMGFVLVIIGLSFFLVGLELALFPLGDDGGAIDYAELFAAGAHHRFWELDVV